MSLIGSFTSWISDMTSAFRGRQADSVGASGFGASITSRYARELVDVASLTIAQRHTAHDYAAALVFGGADERAIGRFVSQEIAKLGKDGVQRNLDSMVALYGAILTKSNIAELADGVRRANRDQGVSLTLAKPDYVAKLRSYPELSGVFNGTKLLKQGNERFDRATELVQLGLQTLSSAREADLSQYGADGRFGQETENEVKEFQRERGLKADGIVGKDTINALTQALNDYFN